jgi:hypothetical protein
MNNNEYETPKLIMISDIAYGACENGPTGTGNCASGSIATADGDCSNGGLASKDCNPLGSNAATCNTGSSG